MLLLAKETLLYVRKENVIFDTDIKLKAISHTEREKFHHLFE